MKPGSAGMPGAPPPLVGMERTLGTLALSLATFMNVLDSSIANVSIPTIAGSLGVSPSQGTWVITSFSVANAISVPLTGWLTRRFGQVRLFVASVLLFVLASWLCGMASNLPMLIACRVLQGLVAGPMVPLSQTLLMGSYPPDKVGKAFAMWSMTTLIAPVAGPTLGGWITEHISWPWIFYINLPVGLLAAAVTWSIYRARDSQPMKVPVDAIGLALVVLTIGSLQIMIDTGKENDWFNSPEIVALAVAAALGMAFLLVWELTERHPIIQLTYFRSRDFTLGTLVLSVGYALFFGNVVLLPMWLQQWMGYTSSWAGLVVSPVGLLAIVLSPWVGKNVTRIDPRKLATVAFVAFAYVMWMRSRFTTDITLVDVLIPLFLQGIGIAFFFIPLSSVVFRGLKPHEMPGASGLSNFCRITAGALGTSIFTTWWDSRAALHRSQLTESIAQGRWVVDQTLSGLQRSGLDSTQSKAVLSRLIDQQAYTMAVTDLFLFSSVLFLALVGLIWMMGRPPVLHKP
jgi:MFS transporter, DHA2 family, multidrug resistance protein